MPNGPWCTNTASRTRAAEPWALEGSPGGAGSRRPEVPFPAVLGHDGLLLGAQPATVTHRYVSLDVADRPHADRDGGHRIMTEHVAQGNLGELVSIDVEVGDEGIDMPLDLRLPVAAEVPVAEVPIGERGLGSDLAGKPAFIQRNPGD